MSQTIDTKNRTIEELKQYFEFYFSQVPQTSILFNSSIFGSKEEQQRILEIETLRSQKNLIKPGEQVPALTLLYGPEFMEFLITTNANLQTPLIDGFFANTYINTLIKARGASLSIENNKSLIVVPDANIDKGKNIVESRYATGTASQYRPMPYYDSSTNNQSRLWDAQIWSLR